MRRLLLLLALLAVGCGDGPVQGDNPAARDGVTASADKMASRRQTLDGMFHGAKRK